MKRICRILFILIVFITLYLINEMPVSASTTINCNQTLKKGSTGGNVITLQKKLNETMKCNLEEDGIYGNLTKSCVIKFQTKYNLTKDGIVGKNTCKKLNSINKDNSNYITIITNNLNIRKTPSTNSSIISTVKLGNSFKVYSTTNNENRTWYKIKANGQYGYISGTYAKKTAIILDISEQNLKMYKNGKILLDTNVVTGRLGKHDTPTGHYIIKSANKTKNRTLRGTNDNGTKYAAHVDYWMPFITNRAIGFHDASWRSQKEYNTNTYKTNGSHGCVNMMHDDAKTLYENLTGNIDVIVKK